MTAGVTHVRLPRMDTKPEVSYEKLARCVGPWNARKMEIAWMYATDSEAWSIAEVGAPEALIRACSEPGR